MKNNLLSDSQQAWITVVFETTKHSKVAEDVHYVYLNLLLRFYKLKCVLGAAKRPESHSSVSSHFRAKNNLSSGSQRAWITVVFEATKPSKLRNHFHYVYLNLLQRFHKLKCVISAATRPKSQSMSVAMGAAILDFSQNFLRHQLESPLRTQQDSLFNLRQIHWISIYETENHPTLISIFLLGLYRDISPSLDGKGRRRRMVTMVTIENTEYCAVGWLRIRLAL